METFSKDKKGYDLVEKVKVYFEICSLIGEVTTRPILGTPIPDLCAALRISACIRNMSSLASAAAAARSIQLRTSASGPGDGSLQAASSPANASAGSAQRRWNVGGRQQSHAVADLRAQLRIELRKQQ